MVRSIYRMMVDEDMGYRRVADALNARGLPAPPGGLWTGSGVLSVITNPALTGRLVERDVVVDGVFLRVLSEEESKRLEERLALNRVLSRGQARAPEYLLTGVLRCGVCDGPMSGRTTRGNGHIYHYYLCSRRTATRAACFNTRNYRTDRLEKAVLEFLGRYSDEATVRALLEADEDKGLVRYEAEHQALRKQLADLKASHARALDQVTRGVLSDELPPGFQGRPREAQPTR